MNLRENIRKYSKEKGIPVYKLEEEIGISKGSISKWDDIKPSVDKVKAAADFLGVSIEELLK